MIRLSIAISFFALIPHLGHSEYSSCDQVEQNVKLVREAIDHATSPHEALRLETQARTVIALQTKCRQAMRNPITGDTVPVFKPSGVLATTCSLHHFDATCCEYPDGSFQMFESSCKAKALCDGGILKPFTGSQCAQQ